MKFDNLLHREHLTTVTELLCSFKKISVKYGIFCEKKHHDKKTNKKSDFCEIIYLLFLYKINELEL